MKYKAAEHKMVRLVTYVAPVSDVMCSIILAKRTSRLFYCARVRAHDTAMLNSLIYVFEPAREVITGEIRMTR